MRYVPLPAPNSVWSARTAQEWAANVRCNKSVCQTLDYMLNKTFHVGTPRVNPNLGLPIPEGTSILSPYDCLGTRLHLGPFARMAMIMTLLRGLLEFGEGKRKGGMVTQLWVLDPQALEIDPEKGMEQRILMTYQRAFDRVIILSFTSYVMDS